MSWKLAIGCPNWLRVPAYSQRRLQRRPRGAQGAPDDAEARLVEAAQRPLEPGHLGQHRVGRQPDGVEDELAGHRRAQRHLVLDLGCREPGCVRGYDEPADALVGLRPDDGDVGDGAVGDPHLATVEHPVVAVAAGAGAHAGRVRPVVGLGQAEAADRLTGGHARQPLRLLLLGPEAPDREHGQGALDGDERPHARSRTASSSRQARPYCGRAHPGAPVPVEVHAQHAEVAELLGQAAKVLDPALLEPGRDVGLRRRSSTKSRTTLRTSRSSWVSIRSMPARSAAGIDGVFAVTVSPCGRGCSWCFG